MDKKGVSMFPFVMMFVLIAGAIIIVFFFGFAKSVKTQGDFVNDLQVANLLERKLDSFTLAKNARNIFELPRISEVDIECRNGKTSIVVGESKRESFKLINAPRSFDNRRLIAWTLAWEYPFKIDNFYYLADNNVRFYFESVGGAGDMRNIIYNNLPTPPFTKFDRLPRNSLELNQADKNIVVYYNNRPSDAVFLSSKAKVIQVDIANNKVAFYRNDGNKDGEAEFFGLPMLYAAIFSEDFQEYECIKDMAHERLKTMAAIYRLKAGNIRSSSECKIIFNLIGGKLANNDFTEDPIGSEFNSELSSLNQRLKGNGCPPLYLTL